MYEDKTKVLIEKYRNFEIYFDTREETFYSISDYYDTEQKKKSYSAAKKAIDEWIKENSSFKPFYVIKCEGWRGTNSFSFPISNEMDVVTISGIRKDKRFTTSDGSQISEYDEDRYFMPLPENEPVFKEMAPVIEELRLYEKLVKEKNKELVELSKKINLITLKQHKKQM